MKKTTAVTLDEDVYEWTNIGYNRSAKINAALRSVMTKSPLENTRSGKKELNKLVGR